MALAGPQRLQHRDLGGGTVHLVSRVTPGSGEDSGWFFGVWKLPEGSDLDVERWKQDARLL